MRANKHTASCHRPVLTEESAESTNSSFIQPLSAHFYEKEIPPFVEKQLETLYQSIYCSVARIRLYEPVNDLMTFIATAGSEIKILILFRINGEVVKVVNQQVRFSKDDLSYFSHQIFAKYATINRIDFYALDCSIDSSAFGFLYQQVPEVEENVIVLPANTEKYLQMLSSKTRNGIIKSIKKTISTYPSYCFDVFEHDQITLDHIKILARLADLRMEFKHRCSYFRPGAIETLARLAQTHGYLSIITINGEICAANLCFIVGTRHFGHVIAHDPCYNAYSLGLQINLQTIMYGISRGAKEFWMMGGGAQEKSRFQAHSVVLNSIFIYRSKKSALRHWPTYIRIEKKKTAFLMKKALVETSLQENLTGQVATTSLLSAGTESTSTDEARDYNQHC